MAKWQDQVEKREQQKENNYQKGLKLLLPVFKKYKFDLSTPDINGKEWSKKEKSDFMKGMVNIGYKEDIVKMYGFYPFEAK